jgi:glycosyltransferase involved in cell wall biosynthesis
MLNIITRCTRIQNLKTIQESILKISGYPVTWWIIFDTHRIKDIDVDILNQIQNDWTKFLFWKGVEGDFGHDLINKCLDQITGWVYVLDDDNIIHPVFADKIATLLKNYNKPLLGYFFNQWIGGKDFTGLNIRIAKPENIKVGGIDMAQILIHTDLIGDHRLPPNQYVADGIWITNIYQKNPDNFIFFEEILCYYNHLQKPSMPISLPRVLVYGVDSIDINSQQPVDFEDSRLRVEVKKSDKDFDKDLIDFKPDAIITIGESFEQFSRLGYSGLEERRKWLHFNQVEDRIGPASYFCAMQSILTSNNIPGEPLVSFFTPFYNTGKKLKRTYESLKKQTYKNWEWVLVNDSTDNGFTLKIAEEIASDDHRVKIYDFREKSGGVVGEAKYRAAVLSKGHYLMELDHDDTLLPEAASLMVKAFQQYPDAKFAYSDAAEVDENNNSLTYGPGFAFGYGKYREEVYDNTLFKVAVSPNINPITIRHIVGVPNHFRAWERNFYFSILGHNRDLTIADDYELIIRTFLKTRMVHIPKLCYLQYYHNSDSLNNTQNSSRADIQRRVRTIMEFYNESIKNRFNELGIEDWAYNYNPTWPLSSPIRIGDDEGKVNYIYKDEESVDDFIQPFIL